MPTCGFTVQDPYAHIASEVHTRQMSTSLSPLHSTSNDAELHPGLRFKTSKRKKEKFMNLQLDKLPKKGLLETNDLSFFHDVLLHSVGSKL